MLHSLLYLTTVTIQLTVTKMLLFYHVYLIFLTHNVRSKLIRGVMLGHKVRRIDVERVSNVCEYNVKHDRGLLKYRT